PSLSPAVHTLFSPDSSSLSCLFFFLLLRPPPTSPLFPYTTLFRSLACPSTLDPSVRLALTRAEGPTWRSSGAQPPWHSRKMCKLDRKSTRLNSSHLVISYAVFCLKKKTNPQTNTSLTRRMHVKMHQ